MFIVILAFLLAPLPIGPLQNEPPELIEPGEDHFVRMRQLTSGGENAEAYFSFDETHLILQSTRDSFSCDQQFVLDLASGRTGLVSTGRGRTTCGYFLPDGERILYSSTHHFSPDCPQTPDFSQGYVWAVYPEFDIFQAKKDGSELQPLTRTPGYDAEATVSPTGDRIVFTSIRSGDLELHSMNLDGTGVKQLTDELGYDGGAFYSWDGSMIVYRSRHYADSAEAVSYRELLLQNLVRPSRMEIYRMDADGANKRQLTNNGAANFAPFFHPDNERVIFSSNLADPKGRNFDLYLIHIDGTNLERITYHSSFDGFPMFTRDGKMLVFASNRNAKVRGETNIFLTAWKD
jgi:Tol biopolymer transport system component